MVLIFFTSLGSAMAIPDDVHFNESDDSTPIISDEDIILEDISADMESSDDNNNPIDNYDSNSIADENIVLKDSNGENIVLEDSNDDMLVPEDQNKKLVSSKKLSSASDSRLINSNEIIYVTGFEGSKSILSSPELIVINDASYYGDSVNTIIQGIIDNAAAGTTIQFTGSSYENIYLRISKPLNIVSKSGTVINNIFNVPVFTIVYGGSGTNITGFTANLTGSFVDASDVSHITISKNKISTKRSAIVLSEVYDSTIKNNAFKRFDIAIDVSKSGGVSITKNNITPENADNVGIRIRDITSSKGISILNNNIIGLDRRKTSTGIFFGKGASNVLLQGNFIRQWYIAIDMPYSVSNVTMFNNTISDNGDGIIINGWINNFTFKKNLVHDNSRVGILFDDNYLGTKGNLDLENNYFSQNGVLDLQNKGNAAVAIGKNFAKRRCARVGMKYGFYIRSRQSGGKYYFSVVDRYGHSVSGLPNFSATLNVNGKSYTVNFIDSVAYLDIGSKGAGGKGSSSSLDIGEDNRKFSEWGQFDQIDSDEMSYYEDFYNELLSSLMGSADSNTNQNSNSSHRNSENSSGSSSSSGSGSGDSGVSSGSNSINSNGVLSGSSGTAGASVSSASSSGASPSQSSNVGESASAKTLSVDEETFRVIGTGGLVLLIMLVIGLYYREDIKDMMEE